MDTLEENNSETWHVDFGGDIRDVSFEEMTAWIAQGDLLRIDRVKKGNLRWIEAGKVPALTDFFNAKDAEVAPAPVVTTSSGVRSNVEVLGQRPVSVPVTSGVASDFTLAPVTPGTPLTSVPPPATAGGPDTDTGVCSVHTDVPSAYICDTCGSPFCKACPKSYGGTVKICPFCGAMCKSVAQVEKVKEETRVQQRVATEGFGFGDFSSSLTYPFKYPVSLIFGAILFALFSVGQGAASFGGAFMLAGAILCFMCANMLSFGVLANVVENFSQGKIGGNFMPSFDDFNIWDDVVHPFFLSIGVYITSFGPLAAVFIVSIFLISGAAKPSASSISPEVAAAPGQIQQGANIKQLVAEQNAKEQQRVEQMTEPTKLAESEATDPTRRNAGTGAPAGASPRGVVDSLPASGANTQAGSLRSDAANTAAAEEEHFQKLNDQIAQAQRSQLESTLGKTPETQAAGQKAMIGKILGYGAVFLFCAGLALLWGLFYLPAACCVAGYTRSFGATLNPTVGLDTIKRLGFDYAKLLFMGLIIVIVSGMVSFILAVVFSAFALPGVGNLPAKFIGSLFGFYLSVVFSCILGFAIFKASDRLQLFRD